MKKGEETNQESSTGFRGSNEPAIIQNQLEMKKMHSDVTENRKVIEELTKSNKWLEDMIEQNKTNTIEYSEQKSSRSPYAEDKMKLHRSPAKDLQANSKAS